MLGIKTKEISDFEVVDVSKKAEDLLTYNIDLMKSVIEDQRGEITRLRRENEELREQVRTLQEASLTRSPMSNAARIITAKDQKKVSSFQGLISQLEAASIEKMNKARKEKEQAS